MRFIRAVAACGCLCLATFSSAHAALVVNGDFETGSLSGFAISAAGGGFVGVDAESPHTGTYGAFFAGLDPNAPDTITQTIATVPGNSYLVSFFLQSEAANAPDNAFSAQFAGATLLTLSDDGGFDYRQFSQTIVAASPQSLLSFSGYNAPAAFDLDDISIVDVTPAAVSPSPSQPLPEPGSAALLLPGALALMRRRGAKADGARPSESA